MLETTHESADVSAAPALSRDGRVWPVVTIAILSYNRREEVRRSLEIIFRELDYPRERIEVIVVDNVSTDGTREMLRDEYPSVLLIANSTGEGIAGWNRAFSNGRGDYFFVLDDDSAPVSGLKDAIAFLENDAATGIVACHITGGSYTTDGLIDGQECIGFIGCGAIIRRNVIDEVGGFADWMFLYAHEFEYALRCVDRGFRIRYFARCVVRHRASPLHRVTRRVVTYSVRNELLIVSKYFGKQRRTYLVRTFVHHLLRHRRDGLSALLNVLEGLWMYLRNPVRKLRTPVRAETQDRYTATFSTTQPLWPLLVGSVKRRLGVRGERLGPS